MRLFAAVDPPAELRGALDAALGSRDSRLRWVPPEQWHVTVAFYGEVAGASVDQLLARLARVADRSRPLDLTVSGLGGFPSRRRARIAYASLAGDTAELERLAERCTAAGRRIGVPMEDRRFRGHLTLGRVREVPMDVTEWPPLPQLPGWPVSALRLVHSQLGSTVRHEVLAEWALGPHQA